jgi:hypothetical protein
MANNRVLPNDNSTTPIVAPIIRWIPLGYTQITSLGTAIGIGPIPTDAIMATIEVEGAAIRYRDDGTPPTASVGMPLVPGQEFSYSVIDFTAIQFIQQAVGAKLNISFYK